MFRRDSKRKQLITLTFAMSEEAYNHWLVGRKGRSINDVVRETIEQTRRCPKPIRELCNQFASGSSSDASAEPSGRTQITLELPADEWEAAVRSVGRIGNEDEPVQPGHLLRAMIQESPSWRQEGDREGEFAAGWHIADLETSVKSLTVSSGEVSLAREELRIAKVGAFAAVAVAVFTGVGSVAGVVDAFAAWRGQEASQHEVGPNASNMRPVMTKRTEMSDEDIYATHMESLRGLRAKGRGYAERLREAAQLLEEGSGRQEHDQFFYSVPSPETLLDVHQQIRATRGQMQRAMPQPKSPDT